ncbi:cyclase family protein [Mesorhizobium helmanticense]|uniref:Cyclase n=1 Tax=Mesorhizobium helmanticense TaxID=1776423 RepID=A0A2T4ILY0_9HYPH|nr:cyclase family protein [Mesorhizobium helmanticense]PTE06654.1 cyclase [Mesorhizobium helmanticense]
MRILDLSQPIRANAGEPVPVSIEVLTHEAGASVLGASRGLTAADFPDGHAISMETVTLTTHTATHIDAPLHYGPLCEGRPARSIDTLPLDWFFGPGVVLRFEPNHNLGPVSGEEMHSALSKLPQRIDQRTIVLCDVGAARLWGQREYFTDFRGIAPEALNELFELGVRVVGTDAFGMDSPFERMLDAYEQKKDKTELWPAHVLGRRREYCQIERLGGLDLLPRSYGFYVACFPIRLESCGAAWTRAVAIFDDANLPGNTLGAVQ